MGYCDVTTYPGALSNSGLDLPSSGLTPAALSGSSQLNQLNWMVFLQTVQNEPYFRRPSLRRAVTMDN